MKTMHTKIIILSISILIINSCVPKSEYNELESKLKATQQELYEVNKNYNQLLEEKNQEEIERNSMPYITELQALKFIKDNFSFYERDTKYRNVNLRRIADNRFEVSLETCMREFSNDNFFWKSSVRHLTVHNDGKYELALGF